MARRNPGLNLISGCPVNFGMGGKGRASKLSPERRREIAKKALDARWAKVRAAKKKAAKSRRRFVAMRAVLTLSREKEVDGT